MATRSDRQRPVALAIVVAMAVLLMPGCAAKSKAGSAGPSVTQVSATLLDQPVEEMYRNAEVVIAAKVDKRVGSVRVDMPSGDDRTPGALDPTVYTEWTVVPHKVYKTDGTVVKGQPLTVALRGGSLGEVSTEFGEEAELAQDEKVVLFLTSKDVPAAESPGRYFTYAAMLGKYKIDDATGMAVNKDRGKDAKLADLENKLK